MDIQELNTTLSRRGYSQFSDTIFGIGAGGYKIKKNIYGIMDMLSGIFQV